MILTYILSFIILSQLVFGLILYKKFKKGYVSKRTLFNELKSNPIKRGLYEDKFNWSSYGGGNTTTVNFVVEFEVIDETQDMIKLRALGVNVSNYTYFDNNHKESYKKVVDNTWYDKNDKRIRMFKEDARSVRNRKLEKILG